MATIMHLRTRIFIRKVAILLIVCTIFALYFISTRSDVKKTKKLVSQRDIVNESRADKNQYSPQETKPERQIATSISAATVRESQNSFTVEEEILHCEEIKTLLEKTKMSSLNTYRAENKDGNRGIFFAEHYDITSQKNLKIVIKEANINNLSDPTELYRYNSAIKEIKNLRQLRMLDFQGAPQVWGSCIEPKRVMYAVTHFVNTQPLCGGNGTDTSCAFAQDIISKLSSTKDPKDAVLAFLQKVICFFVQFEKYHVFMEDISGGNFHVSPDTWDLFLVDADSIILYGGAPLLSRMSCRKSTDCLYPVGNFWPSHSLNQKIYYACGEMYGICQNNTCRGVDTGLHTCGIARWLVTSLRKLIPLSFYDHYQKMKNCMREFEPSRRCTMAEACELATLTLQKYRHAQAESLACLINGRRCP